MDLNTPNYQTLVRKKKEDIFMIFKVDKVFLDTIPKVQSMVFEV